MECVVCLEEYVDGVSKVMSLPCGHEFHVDCMYVYNYGIVMIMILICAQNTMANYPPAHLPDLQG